MKLRDALISQHPSLELQRAAQAEIARLDAKLERMEHNLRVLHDALSKACGDDKDVVDATVESQGGLL